MTCIVHGFPSKYAALQFEWAWQNTHATRHIEARERERRVGELSKARKSPTKRARRPPMSLEARLKNMHFLLGVKSFRRWPLSIRFFSTDVFELWNKHSAKMSVPLRKDVTVQLTPAELPKMIASAEGSQSYTIPNVIKQIPVAYEDCKAHVEKARSIFEEERVPSCGVCRKTADPSKSLVLVCPLQACLAVSHLRCLSTKFLEEEGASDAIIPVEGTCPGCSKLVKWGDLVKELSLRLRGQKEVEAMFKPKRKRKAIDPSESVPVAAEPQPLDEEDEELDETWMQEVNDDDEEFPSIERIGKERPRTATEDDEFLDIEKISSGKSGTILDDGFLVIEEISRGKSRTILDDEFLDIEEISRGKSRAAPEDEEFPSIEKIMRKKAKT
jgi:structure-specific endonuclease subunit SLX1